MYKTSLLSYFTTFAITYALGVISIHRPSAVEAL